VACQRGLLLPRRKSNKKARGTTDFGDLTALQIRELKELAETFWVRETFRVAQTTFNSTNFQDVRCPPKRSNAGLFGKCLLTFFRRYRFGKMRLRNTRFLQSPQSFP
ncbi:hypothetical protein, partial [Flavobacterium sp.]|uniref:hypothetical protein n=1 Tax=Flavobacterium sp. TaxID=239 RepID=UPI0025C6C4C9